MSSDIVQRQAHFMDDMMYFDKHRQELVDRHREQWVAIYDLKVVGAARELELLIAQLKRDGVPPAHTYVEYATDEDFILIPAVSYS